MIDITSEEYWDDKFEEKKEKQKLCFSSKIIMIGLILFGICTVINSVLIYAFFNILNKMA